MSPSSQGFPLPSHVLGDGTIRATIHFAVPLDGTRTRWRIVCLDEEGSHGIASGKTMAHMRTDEIRVATCPNCKRTKEYRDALAEIEKSEEARRGKEADALLGLPIHFALPTGPKKTAWRLVCSASGGMRTGDPRAVSCLDCLETEEHRNALSGCSQSAAPIRATESDGENSTLEIAGFPLPTHVLEDGTTHTTIHFAVQLDGTRERWRNACMDEKATHGMARGKITAHMRSDDIKAVTCPNCQRTKEYQEAAVGDGEEITPLDIAGVPLPTHVLEDGSSHTTIHLAVPLDEKHERWRIVCLDEKAAQGTAHGKIMAHMRTDDPRVATCPNCQRTQEYRELSALCAKKRPRSL